jgi:hypothetical protein
MPNATGFMAALPSAKKARLPASGQKLGAKAVHSVAALHTPQLSASSGGRGT